MPVGEVEGEDSSGSGSESDSAGPSCREKGSTSKQQRTLLLASIGNLSDRALQQMLFKRRFFFRLKPSRRSVLSPEFPPTIRPSQTKPAEL